LFKEVNVSCVIKSLQNEGLIVIISNLKLITKEGAEVIKIIGLTGGMSWGSFLIR
jgi:hypothetical protein